MKPDGRGWLFVPTGLVDGPLPTHYEPVESPVNNELYEQQTSPVLKYWKDADNPLAKVGDPRYPCIMTTYRLTEHYLSGAMSRWLPWLAELQPELFIEIGRELAQEKGIKNLDWCKISSPRGADPRQGARHEPHRLHDARRQEGASRRDAVALGLSGHRHRRRRQRPDGLRRRSERLDPRGEGVRVQRGEGVMGGLVVYVWRASNLRSSFATQLEDEPSRAHGFLHRHDRLHRLQGVRGRLQGVEPAPRATNGGVNTLSGDSYDNTRQLDGINWRHVKFIEQFPEDRTQDGRWLMMSDVCKHCVQAPCLEVCPTGAIIRTEFDTVVIQSDACNGCRDCIAACPFGVIDINPVSNTSRRSARSATTALQVGLEPACAKACPTESIQFGTISELKGRAQKRVDQLHEHGRENARISTARTKRCSADSTRFTCWWISRRCTGCRAIRKTSPQNNKEPVVFAIRRGRDGIRGCADAARQPHARGRARARGGEVTMQTNLPSTFFTAPPGFGWFIILYFFIGGIAGGALMLAGLLRIFGRTEDRAYIQIASVLPSRARRSAACS